LFRALNSIEETTDGPKRIVHAHVCGDGVFKLLKDWALMARRVIISRKKQNGKPIDRGQRSSA
jgi:hypothetical protein